MSKNFISLFDIVGPVMIGPSSSHTAGAARMGYEAYKALGDVPEKVTIKLFNSFSDTGKGHKTDLAVLGGCLGIQPDDEKIIEAAKIAKKMGVKFKIKWGYHSNDLHPNTAIVKLRKGDQVVSLVGYSIGGGRIDIAKLSKNGKANDHIENQVKKYQPSKGASAQYYSFNNLRSRSKSVRQYLKIVLDTERETNKSLEVAPIEEFQRRWKIMIESIEKGVKIRRRSQDGMFGGDSNRMLRSRFNILSKVVENGITYSIGVAELNAKMGKIVATPTAGSCGIVPGVLYSLQKKFHFSHGKMSEALAIAASIGAVVSRQVELAGAVAGCQAEIGVAGSMAAAAGVYLLGGNLVRIESAASLVLGNLLGLTCDPIMGRVEVPCILRNGMVTSMVFAAIEMSLDGIVYQLPFDEVIGVMKKVGYDLDEDYRETSTGGLATTKTAKRICKSCKSCSGCRR